MVKNSRTTRMENRQQSALVNDSGPRSALADARGQRLASRKAERVMHPSAQLLSMNGQYVLVSGAAAGIGKAIALRFAEAGAALLLLDIDEAGLAQTAGEAKAFSHQVKTQRVDLAHKQQIDTFWSHFGGDLPDTLINTVGSYPLQPYLKVNASSLEQTLRVNLESAFWMCQHFIARRKEQGGVIVNIASVEALVPLRDDLIPYSVSKAGNPCPHPRAGPRLRQVRLPRERPGSRRNHHTGDATAQEGCHETAGC
jgi:hypothetical protein